MQEERLALPRQAAGGPAFMMRQPPAAIVRAMRTQPAPAAA